MASREPGPFASSLGDNGLNAKSKINGEHPVQFRIESLTQSDAETIATWHYEGEYAFYDAEADAEDLAELLDPALRGDSMFGVRDGEGKLIGFFAFQVADGVVDFGLGLRPDLTGKGLGADFAHAGLDFAQSRFSPKNIQLRVAAFNKRAIKVYQQIGFREVEHYMNRTNGGEFEFVRMELADTQE